MIDENRMYNLVMEAGREIAHKIQRVAMENDPEASDKVRAIYVTAGSLQGSLHLVASLVGWPKGQDDYLPTNRPADCINEDSILFAALLMSKMGSLERRGTEVYTKIRFGPEELIYALDATEKLLGRRLEDGMDRDLMDKIREVKAEGFEPNQDMAGNLFTAWPETIQ